MNVSKSKCLHHLFEEQVEKTPEAIAIVYENQKITYGELNKHANQLAHYLLSLGVKPNMTIGICMERSMNLIFGLLAILKAGGTYLPIDLSYPPERLSFMLEDCESPILLTQRSLADKVPASKAKIVYVDEFNFNGGNSSNPKIKCNEENLIYIIYTSGSTGKPNGVMVTHKNVIRLFNSTDSLYSFNQGDIWTFFHSYAFDFSVWEIWGALLYGGKLVIVPYLISRSPELFYDLLLKEKVTVLNQTPASFYQLIEVDKKTSRSDSLELRTIILGGEPLKPLLLKPWLEKYGDEQPRLYNGYGPTEATVFTTFKKITIDNLSEKSIIGKPIEDVDVYILDEKLNEVGDGTQGELYIGGAGLSLGYINRSELNKSRFIRNPFSKNINERLYKTGDLGRWISGHEIEYLGRIDFQVKIRGFRIELGEIENNIRSYPAIKDAVVKIHKYSEDVIIIIAYLISEKNVSLNDLKKHLTKFLPDYMVPNSFIIIDKIPLTTNGKTDFNALPIPEQRTSKRDLSILVEEYDKFEEKLIDIWKELLGLESIDITDNFFDIGGNSLLMGRLQIKVNQIFDENVSIVDLFQYPTISSLAKFISKKLDVAKNSTNIAPQKNNQTSTDIAIVGMAGRFPKAKTVKEFWNNLINGVESISFYKEEELEFIPKGVTNSEVKFVKARGILEDVDKFDAEFFGFNPREAAIMDPQHRVFLECAWQALEDAGYCSEKYNGSIGIFAGSSFNTYLMYNVLKDRESNAEMANAYQITDYVTLTGNDNSFLTTKVAYKLGLKGPAVNIQTACSTSLVAIGQAYKSLISGESDMALAGGVSITFPQKRGYFYIDGSLGSSDGHCKPFDADATGTVFSSAAAIVVMKRLEDAVRDGDSIYSVIKSVALNNDGSEKAGYMTPSVEGQSDVIIKAQQLAGIDPSTINYVETHGTGTPVGDPIEVASLVKAFRESTNEKQFCGIGSVKSNIGHTDAASGVTGVIKTALSLNNRVIPPTLHFTKPNPRIDFNNSPFYVVDKLTNLNGTKRPYRAAVSAFGVGGTNAHAILEEYPDISFSCEEDRDKYLVIVSGKTENSLNDNMNTFMDYLKNNTDEAINDVAYTLQLGRKEFEWRQFFIADSCLGALEEIGNVIKSGTNKAKINTKERPHVVFMFPGQGAQYVNMGKGLYTREKIFREVVDHCAEFLKPHLELDIRELLYPKINSEETAKKLEQTVYTQPALFIIEYALAQLFLSYGIKSHSMIGHSVGDYVAACLAGVFTLEDALYIIAVRARQMQNQKPGSMLSVRTGEDKITKYLDNDICLAAINSPNLVVLSGPIEKVIELSGVLSKENIENKVLYTSHAYHSNMMEPAIEPFISEFAKIKLYKPTSPFVSSLTGTWIKDDEATDPKFWASQLRDTVRFSNGILELQKKNNLIFLELGPGRALSTMASQHRNENVKQTAITTIIQPNEKNDDKTNLLIAVGKLWLEGLTIEWPNFYKGKKRRRLHLPVYQFDRKSYWIEPVNNGKSKEQPTIVEHTPQKVKKLVKKPKIKKMLQESSMTRKEYIVDILKDVLEELSGMKKADLEQSKSFLELGFDSLFMTQVSLAFQKKFEVKITLRQLLETSPTIYAIAEFIDSKLPEAKFEPPKQEVVVEEESVEIMEEYEELSASENISDIKYSSGNSTVEKLVHEQLEIMKKQLEVLSGKGVKNIPVVTEETKTTKESFVSEKVPVSKTEIISNENNKKKVFEKFGPYNPIKTNKDGELTDKQQRYLNKLINEYTTKTQTSKKLTQKHRAHYSDPRTVSGFLPLWKEMTYQVIINKSEGSKLWDLDGNEYIDLIMGFGQYMFGHNPKFVRDAIEKQLKLGFEIGPQSPIAGEVARLICEFTGFDRAAFCVTGSEAVLGALRAARTVTGKDKIVFFAGDYHGVIDEVLIKTVVNGDQVRTMPIAPGIPRENVQNTIALEYGTEASLKTIEKLLPEIAGIMVEPVQSRRPELQPKEFLQKLRKITEDSKIPLIFDEVVTGFRTAQGGAQEWFGIKADIGTYGKVIGGGIPIGVIAGKKLYMDSFDGGYWQYGDDSIPEAGVTFLAGTFVRHPLALTACQTVLNYLKSKKGTLQQKLNQKSKEFIEELNSFMLQRNVPIKMANFGSVIYYNHPKDLGYFSLLFYLLRHKGIHILEGFPMFLSEAHSDKDIGLIIDAFKESIVELQDNGFFPAPISSDGKMSHESVIVESSDTNRFPLTDAQKEIWIASQMSSEASCAFNESARLELIGKLDKAVLEKAFNIVLQKHESLRTTFSKDGTFQKTNSEVNSKLKFTDLQGLTENDRKKKLEEILDKETKLLFDFVNGPLIRGELVTLSEQHNILIITAHHIICDGWSFDVMTTDLSKIYTEIIQGKTIETSAPMQMRDFVAYLEDIKKTDEYRNQEDYWLNKLKSPLNGTYLPVDNKRLGIRSFKGSRIIGKIEPNLFKKVKELSYTTGNTIFVTLLSAFSILLNKLTNEEDIVTGIPAAGQQVIGVHELVGHCTNLLPVRFDVNPETKFEEFLSQVKLLVLDAFDNQQVTYGDIITKLKLDRNPGKTPLLSTMFNIDPTIMGLKFAELECKMISNPRCGYQFELGFNLVNLEQECLIECDYNTDLFSQSTIYKFIKYYKYILEQIIEDSSQPLKEIKILSAFEINDIMNILNNKNS